MPLRIDPCTLHFAGTTGNPRFPSSNGSGVNDALQCIISKSFDVLLTDLQMRGDADGLTVVSAMRNAHPMAVTQVYSRYPEMEGARKCHPDAGGPDSAEAY
jgi:CheY-like chemotaxis protein